MSETLTKKNVPSLKILVADDNQTMRELLCNLLSGAGYEVSAADSAEAALQLFGSHHYPLVITDIRMPGMSGIDLLQQIKKMDSETEVVIMTGHGTLDTAILALRAGAYDYLLKPFDDLELITALVNRAVEKITMNIENKLLIGKLKRKNDELESFQKIQRQVWPFSGRQAPVRPGRNIARLFPAIRHCRPLWRRGIYSGAAGNHQGRRADSGGKYPYSSG